MRLKNFYKKVYTYLFLFLFIGYFGSVTFFSHTHIINGGVSITHSHPYKSGKAGFPNHTHSEKEYITIHLLSLFFVSILTVSFVLNSVSPHVNRLLARAIERSGKSFVHYLYLLRAPPAI